MPDKIHLIEGPYRNFTVHRVRPEDVDKLCQHIKDHFLHDEPTSKLCGYTEEFGDEFCAIFKHFIPDNLSFWMEDNETGEVAALRATFINRKGEDPWSLFPRNSRPLQVLMRVVDLCLEQVNIFERYGITEYADFLVASSSPKYRNQGLTKELYRRTLILLKAEGIQLAKSVFTSPFTRRAVQNLGFEEIARVDYKTLRDTEGNLIFDPAVLTDEHYGSMMAKVIN